MAAHSSILAWRIPWTEEPGGLLSMGSHRVRHDWSDLATAAVYTHTHTHTHTHTRILLSHQKEWNDAICNNMDEAGDDCTSWSEPEKGRYHMMSLICGIYNMVQVNKSTKQNRLTDMVAKGKVGGWWRDWEFGISGCKLLYMRWINNKVLLYSTENYTSYLSLFYFISTYISFHFICDKP